MQLIAASWAIITICDRIHPSDSSTNHCITTPSALPVIIIFPFCIDEICRIRFFGLFGPHKTRGIIRPVFSVNITLFCSEKIEQISKIIEVDNY
jgi:hypothetical protein